MDCYKSDIHSKVQAVRCQITELDKKKAVLSELLKKLEQQSPSAVSQQIQAPTKYQYPFIQFTDDDIRFFASLFRGREDVFPKRWESRTGKSGYSPVCKNEWKRGLCLKPKARCAECSNKEYIPLAADHIRQHLTGHITIGVYPLLENETCRFLTVDFDKKSWMEDVAAFAETCKKRSISCAVERSRSGKGAHVWFFFDSPVSARLARRFGCALLTETMERRHQIGLDSYDRLFPSQDTMPKGGFGNLIALPLQPEPVKSGNSLFIDANFTPYPDQWEFLKSVQRLSEDLIKAVEEDAARRGRILGVRAAISDDGEQPWDIPPSGRKSIKISGPLPVRLDVVYSNFLYVPKERLPSSLINQIIRLAAFQNPEFYQAQAMRQSTFNKPRIISCAEEFDKYLALPRGCLEELKSLLNGLGIQVVIDDKRFGGKPLNVGFLGTLTAEQEQSVDAILNHDLGVISAPPAFGKRVVAAKIISARAVNTLILVCRQQLMDQWRERLATFLDIKPEYIGTIGGGKKKATGMIDVAMLQSLNRQGTVADLIAEYGYIILDECHHGSAVTFEQVLRQTRARFITGLTATPTRKDGHHPIIFMQCGPIRYTLSAKQSEQHSLLAHRVVVRFTETDTVGPEGQVQMNDIYTTIMRDEPRMQMIVRDIREAVVQGKSPLVLTERREHLDMLAERFGQIASHIIVLHGNMGTKKRREAMNRLMSMPEGESRILLSTGKYIGEGFDDSRLDCLFLTMPISWKGTLQQYAGRLHRVHHAKREVVIYDYVDGKMPIPARMFDRRKKGYTAMGYEIA